MLNDISKKIRRDILTEAYLHKHGHITSCFSCVEILMAIKEVMKEGDRFILSKRDAEDKKIEMVVFINDNRINK